MPVHNSDIVEKLNKSADLLDIQGANQFRIRAYRSVAQTISGLSYNVANMLKEGKDVSQLPNIGSSIAEKIHEIVETGSLDQLEKLEKKLPEKLADLMKIPNLGPKKIQKLYNELNISNREELEKAAVRCIITPTCPGKSKPIVCSKRQKIMAVSSNVMRNRIDWI